MNYIDRRTKKFKNLEKSVCSLIKKETCFNAFKIESITDSPYEETMLRILVKIKHKAVECGIDVLVNKDLFTVVNDWSDSVLKKDNSLILDVCSGHRSLHDI